MTIWICATIMGLISFRWPWARFVDYHNGALLPTRGGPLDKSIFHRIVSMACGIAIGHMLGQGLCVHLGIC